MESTIIEAQDIGQINAYCESGNWYVHQLIVRTDLDHERVVYTTYLAVLYRYLEQ